ncbi:MAG: hypothetical protein PWP08_262 [Methanofollis sp.]|nr:hypothetical protein [Methanofollis sp.]
MDRNTGHRCPSPIFIRGDLPPAREKDKKFFVLLWGGLLINMPSSIRGRCPRTPGIAIGSGRQRENRKAARKVMVFSGITGRNRRGSDTLLSGECGSIDRNCHGAIWGRGAIRDRAGRSADKIFSRARFFEIFRISLYLTFLKKYV